MTRGRDADRPALVLAHRGDHRRWIENTADALLDACRLPGVDGVEFDVRVAADGEPVILHDETLARTFGVPLVVREEASITLIRLGVPDLVQMLALLPEHAFLDIELKDPPTSATLAAIRGTRGATLRHAVVSSFEASILAEVHAREPEWPLWLNAVGLNRWSVAEARAIGCRGIAAHWSSVTPKAVEAARSAGLEIAIWTVRRRPTRERLEALGVDAVIVEGPALAPRPDPGSPDVLRQEETPVRR